MKINWREVFTGILYACLALILGFAIAFAFGKFNP
jgi:hypothetical protein